MIHFESEFHAKYKTGDTISVTLSKYDRVGEWIKVNPEYIIRNYVIGKTDLDDSHGQVELIHKVNVMIVEYQWFNRNINGRKIKIK
jgi:hypothetical protein